MFKKLSIVFLALSLFACSDAGKNDIKAAATTGNAEKYVEGKHYTRIQNPATHDSDKIVVTEFFWYGCPHCEHFEPLLVTWKKNQADDVILTRSPAIWRESMKLHAKVFYLIQTLPNWEFVHTGLFTLIIALHEENDLEVQKQKIGKFLSAFGVSEADYQKKMASPELDLPVESAMALMQQSGANGTPAIMVNGKYLVNNQAAGSPEEILQIADFLVEKERAAKKKE